jgi:thioester reductase-like protein
MTNISDRIASLSPEQRKLLRMRLQQESGGLRPKPTAFMPKQPDLHAEAILDDDIRPVSPCANPVVSPEAVFLTGGTGFLGAFLIRELLLKTSADIYCLVRAKDLEQGRQRLEQNLTRYDIWEASFAQRIFPVLGNITQPHLGISESEYAQLTETIDVVYHSAATLNYILPYNSLKPANVEGTKEVLRFACQAKAKPVHHISSVAVLESSAYAGQVLTETDDLNATEGMVLGYSQSKWVAEKLVLSAGDRGLPVTIHRASFISGDSKTGVTNTNDFVCIMLKYFFQVKAVPELNFVLDASPVDYVSRAIVYLSQQPESMGQVFHLQNPYPVPLSTLVTGCKQLLGVKFEQLPYKEWTEKLKSFARSPDYVRSADNPMYRLLPFFTEPYSAEGLTIPELNSGEHRPTISCQRTLNALKGSGLACPKPNAKALASMIAYFRKSRFLEMSLPLQRSLLLRYLTASPSQQLTMLVISGLSLVAMLVLVFAELTGETIF